jgi:hypothetical protein
MTTPAREIAIRRIARRAALRAGVPLLRRTVDRARVLLEENADVKDGAVDITIDALQREYGRRRG